MEVSSADKYEDAFKEAIKAHSGALAVTLNALANSNQKRIADLAMHYRWASVCARDNYADNGNLMAYGPGYSTEGIDGACYLSKILKGAKPADIPVEQPTKFELIINLKAAKQIAVTIPPILLERADRVIKSETQWEKLEKTKPLSVKELIVSTRLLKNVGDNSVPYLLVQCFTNTSLSPQTRKYGGKSM